MNHDDIASLAMKYYEKMRANYHNDDNHKITPENVFQKGIRHNYDLFMELVDRLMLPGSGVKGAENLQETFSILKGGESVLFLMKHSGNFDVPCIYSLLSREGNQYQDILDRLVFIAGRKLNEDSPIVKIFTEVFSRLIVVPHREIPRDTDHETREQKAHRQALVREATRINRASLREMMRLKKQGYIIVLFPMGGRPKPWLNEHNNGVKETTSYMRLFDWVHFIGMTGNLMPVGDTMQDEKPRRDTIVFTVSEPIRAKAYLEESRRLFKGQNEIDDFDQFNVNRVMKAIGQTRD
ncbi:MAG: 1-acyl-sn-glycerol-3-phosphate acyltransferase [Deltaproteobacteria bacterium]|nr:1-acyl-sn-glycerol-3-phosphate acyltransferase [Deltaproteobacteria bacterium]